MASYVALRHHNAGLMHSFNLVVYLHQELRVASSMPGARGACETGIGLTDLEIRAKLNMYGIV